MPRIVVIDDQTTTLKMLNKILSGIVKFGPIEIFTFDNETKALSWLRDNKADLVLLDYKLPRLNGLELINLLRLWEHYKSVPIIMVTAYDDIPLRYAALDAGVSDFISKPIDFRECQARCTNLLQMHLHQQQLEYHNKNLTDQVRTNVETIMVREREALYHLAKAGEYRDADTGNHIYRISKYSRLIAEGIGMTEEFCDLIEHASPMHDVGKIGIPDNILLKPGKLSPLEWNIMQKHSEMGFEILAGSSSTYMQMGATIALHHHEKFNGKGYPSGLSGDHIPLEARIVAVADVFDALTSVRPYKTPWSVTDALSFLNNEAGIHFDPVCVSAFTRLSENIKDIHHTYSENKVVPIHKIRD